ncbi:MAG: redoxin domain-containing protein [Clostridia bacterium]|nr:MAG: redoxin domain-containing protein [Clostridia bacterium]
MGRKLIITIAIVAGVLLVVFLASSRYLHGIPEGPGPAGDSSGPTAAADFTLTDLEGKTVSLADFRGRPVVLNFWYTG